MAWPLSPSACLLPPSMSPPFSPTTPAGTGHVLSGAVAGGGRRGAPGSDGSRLRWHRHFGSGRRSSGGKGAVYCRPLLGRVLGEGLLEQYFWPNSLDIENGDGKGELLEMLMWHHLTHQSSN